MERPAECVKKAVRLGGPEVAGKCEFTGAFTSPDLCSETSRGRRPREYGKDAGGLFSIRRLIFTPVCRMIRFHDWGGFLERRRKDVE